jgi:hypothetical protein
VPRISLVDFGIAAFDGLHLPGGTPGYAPDRQGAGEAPDPGDDRHALGMSLIEAVTGLPPLYGVSSADARARALETISARWGATPNGVLGVVIDLMHDDAAVAASALRRLHTDPTCHCLTTRLPTPPVVDTGSVAELAEVLLSRLIRQVDAVLSVPPRRHQANPTVYGGLAGVGLELLRHGDRPEDRKRIERLLSRVVADTAELGPGLLSGHTGVDLFIREARDWLGLPALPWEWSDPVDWPADYDLVSGAAGIGLGHLWGHRQTGDAHHQEMLRRCAATLSAAAPEAPGLAHGLAGIVLFDLVATDLIGHSGTGDRRAALLAAAESLIARATVGSGDPLRTASWCNGLTGVARVLAEAGRRGDPSCLRSALAAGDALDGWISRSVHLGQCCGVAGIGEFLLDLSALPGGERFAAATHAAARHILLRSAGSHDRREPVLSSDEQEGLSWAAGLSGILGFIRRLRDRGGPRLFSSTSGL